jgi:N4-gp56 family major capsid protein
MLNTTSNLPATIREYYERLVLLTAHPKQQHTKFAQKKQMPKKNGDTIDFKRYSKLATVPIPLVEGVTPPGAQLSASTIKARVSPYGNFVMFSDWVEMTNEDNILNQSTTLLGKNQGETIDEITRDVLVSCTSVYSCSNGVNLNTPTELTKLDIDAVVKSLLGNEAEMISSLVTSSTGQGTTPIRPAFMGIIHTDQLDDLEAVSNFISTANYGGQGTVLDGEWGATGNVRWVYTSVGSVSAAATPVYNNIIVGKESHAVVSLAGSTGNFYVEQLGSGGSSDPLHQRGSVGWSHPFTARILNDSFMGILLSTHS